MSSSRRALPDQASSRGRLFDASVILFCRESGTQCQTQPDDQSVRFRSEYLKTLRQIVMICRWEWTPRPASIFVRNCWKSTGRRSTRPGCGRTYRRAIHSIASDCGSSGGYACRPGLATTWIAGRFRRLEIPSVRRCWRGACGQRVDHPSQRGIARPPPGIVPLTEVVELAPDFLAQYPRACAKSGKSLWGFRVFVRLAVAMSVPLQLRGPV